MENVEPEDWTELINALRTVEKNVCSLDGEPDAGARIEACRQSLKSFHTTAAMLGMGEIEQAGLGLERYLNERIAPSKNADAIYAFGFALNALMDQMRKAAGGENHPISASEILKILETGALQDEAGQGGEREADLTDEEAIKELLKPSLPEVSVDLSRLGRIVENLGGALSLDAGPDQAPSFIIRFEAKPSVVEQIETLLTPGDPSITLAPNLSQQDTRWEKIVGTVKEFMLALSSGDIKRAEEILLYFSEQQDQAGLYNEIGMMARELHNSLKGFMTTLDPALKEMVEDKLPDSGSRLEHILEITERAANTTLDHVEMMQKRNQQDQGRVVRLLETIGGLHAIGEQAQKKLGSGRGLMEELQSSVLKTHEDLITILTAQDFQDLTGQVIQKIIKLLKDLELKLVNVIRVFGVKMEGIKKPEEPKELYGPAHKEREGALHSQDDVDSLLADFGF